MYVDMLARREGGDIGLFITLVPKVYYYGFLFVGLTTLSNFNLLVN